jgi:hypothetical protein
MKLFSSLAISALALVACIGGTGCAADGTTPDEENGAGSTSSELGSNISLPNPGIQGGFVKVVANGTGCPAGSWDAAISPDGQAFTVSFSQYETMVNPGQALSIKDCTLGIDLVSPNGLTFAVNSFYYQGYALLDQPGMTAKQTAKYYFQGNPVGSREYGSDMTGPFDNSYLFTDNVGVVDLVWSPCGVTRRLTAQTRLVLRNNPQSSGTGYLNNATIDVNHKIAFRFGLSWRTC